MHRKAHIREENTAEVPHVKASFDSWPLAARSKALFDAVVVLEPARGVRMSTRHIAAAPCSAGRYSIAVVGPPLELTW